RPQISLARPRRWSPPLPAGVVPAYDEAVKLIRADARRVRAEVRSQRAEVERAHALLCGELPPGAEPLVGLERSVVEERVEDMREKLHILDVQSEVNLPEVRWSVANGMADMSVPSHRHLVEQRWRKDGDLDLLMERIHQMHVVPDVLPVLHPSLDLHLTARLLPVHFDALMHRNRAQRRVNTFKDVVPGNYLTPRQTRALPKLYANVFHTDVRLYTMLMVDPDVPDEETRTFTTFLHWLKPNIPLSATHTGRIPLLNTHTRYVPPHPQRGTPYHRYVTLLLPQPPLPGKKYNRSTEALMTAQQARLAQSLRDQAAADAARAAAIPVVADAGRLRFDVRAFAREWGLNGAVGGGVHMFREVWDKDVGAVYRYDLHEPQPRYARPPRADAKAQRAAAYAGPTPQKYRLGA
ncbi:phosphatidylethanolamine-binding protein, partial [Mycena pura]